MTNEQTVKKIISEVLKISEDKINLNDELGDLVSDSIQLFELLIRFEQELGEKVRYEDIADIESVGDIVKYATLKNFANIYVNKIDSPESEAQFS